MNYKSDNSDVTPTEIHVYYCWDVLHAHLNGHEIPNGDQFRDDGHFPLFVTWKHKETEVLRGCIGNFSPLSLQNGFPNSILSNTHCLILILIEE